jgi:hypothetical protein
MTKIGRAEATALMMASLCVSVVKADPELIKRLRKLAKKTGAPVEDTNAINEVALSLIDLAITAMALRAAEGGGQGDDAMRSQGRHASHQHRVSSVVIPVPHMEDGAAKSAGALAIGSFAVEYLHKVPGVREAFSAWMDEAHPGATNGKRNTEPGTLKEADETLTIMAHVAGQIADDHAAAH